MFVSSYSTYIQSDISTKENRQRLEKPSAESDFSSKLSKASSSVDFKSSVTPIDYISKSQAHTNKQEIAYQQEKLKNPESKILNDTKETLNKFTAHSSLTSAKNAYENINKAFTAFSKNTATLNQTPQMDNNLPEEAQEAKELSMRYKMVNTYISNDNYYRITA